MEKMQTRGQMLEGLAREAQAERAMLYSWSARRAGGRITVTHSCGKVPNIDVIEPRGGKLIAVQASAAASGSAPGREFILHVPAEG